MDFPSPRYHSAKLEKPGIISSDEKKTTFTVLVTGMGVSNVIQFFFLISLFTLAYLTHIQRRHFLKVQDMTAVAITLKMTTLLT